MDFDKELADLIGEFSKGDCQTDLMDDFSRGDYQTGSGNKEVAAIQDDADSMRRRLAIAAKPVQCSIGYYKRRIAKPAQPRSKNKKTNGPTTPSNSKTPKAPATPRPKPKLGASVKQVDTLKKYQSRAHKKARKEASDAGKSADEITKAGRVAYAKATLHWKKTST